MRWLVRETLARSEAGLYEGAASSAFARRPPLATIVVGHTSEICVIVDD